MLEVEGHLVVYGLLLEVDRTVVLALTAVAPQKVHLILHLVGNSVGHSGTVHLDVRMLGNAAVAGYNHVVRSVGHKTHHLIRIVGPVLQWTVAP